MPIRYCEICGEGFTKKSTYDYHINRKYKCVPEDIKQKFYKKKNKLSNLSDDKKKSVVKDKNISILDTRKRNTDSTHGELGDDHYDIKNNTKKNIDSNNDANIDENVDGNIDDNEDKNIDIKKNLRRYICDICGNDFSTKGNLSRHINRGACKKEKKETESEEIIKLRKELEEFKIKFQTEIEKMKNTQNTQNTQNIQNNIVNNQVINIITPYSRDNIGQIDPAKFLECLRHGYNSTLKMVEAVHFDPAHPERHNVYISNLKNKYAMVYKDNSWYVVLEEALVEELYTNHKEYIEENMDVFYDKLLPSQQKSLYRWIETNDEDPKIKKIKFDLKLLLFNKRDMVLGKNNKNASLNASDPVLDLKPSIKK